MKIVIDRNTGEILSASELTQAQKDTLWAEIVRKEELERSLECAQLWVDEVTGALRS